MDVTYPFTIVPCICQGVIVNDIKKDKLFEVQIIKSPIGQMSGPLQCTAIYNPGLNGNYKKHDRVKCLINMIFNNLEGKFTDISGGGNGLILGVFDERSVVNVSIDNPFAIEDPNTIKFVDRTTKAGLYVNDEGKVWLTTPSSMAFLMDPFGHAIQKNSVSLYAQNHHRIVSHNFPYLSREYFGLFEGNDDEDEVSRSQPEDRYIVYRRFVAQSLDPEDWVSSCEGLWAPWVGPNNDDISISKSREVLFTKIVNKGNSRLTIEAGEPGDGFFVLRVDDIIISEKKLPSGGATPATLGNRFKIKISDKGTLEIQGSGQGTSPLNKFQLKVTESGDVTVQASGLITLSHGDSDTNINSITLDPQAGIDIVAKKGFRVNGLELLTKEFLTWMDTNQAQLCQVTSIGGPAPIHPLALPDFNIKKSSPADAGGFTTKGVDINAPGVIQRDDFHQSV